MHVQRESDKYLHRFEQADTELRMMKTMSGLMGFGLPDMSCSSSWQHSMRSPSPQRQLHFGAIPGMSHNSSWQHGTRSPSPHRQLHFGAIPSVSHNSAARWSQASNPPLPPDVHRQWGQVLTHPGDRGGLESSRSPSGACDTRLDVSHDTRAASNDASAPTSPRVEPAGLCAPLRPIDIDPVAPEVYGNWFPVEKLMYYAL